MIIAANWKLYKSYRETLSWIISHKDELETYAHRHTLILCTEHTTLAPLTQILHTSSIACGAQDCSMHENGAYTGEVAARSLSEIGCQYCLIGHSERRHYHNESSADVAQKMSCLFHQSVTPIICIGETLEEREAGKAFGVVQDQLTALVESTQHHTGQLWHIAYEPRWAIGKGITPTQDELQEMVYTIDKQCRYLFGMSIPVLYGGSVNNESIDMLLNIENLSGFLIGSASIDFDIFNQLLSHINNAVKER